MLLLTRRLLGIYQSTFTTLPRTDLFLFFFFFLFFSFRFHLEKGRSGIFTGTIGEQEERTGVMV